MKKSWWLLGIGLVCLALLLFFIIPRKKEVGKTTSKRREAPIKKSLQPKEKALTFVLESDLNIWQALVNGSTFGYLNEYGTDKTLKVPLHYGVGFDLLLGIEFAERGWLLSLAYTYFREKGHHSTLATDSSVIIPTKGVILEGETVTDADSSFTVSWNNIDLSLDKTVQVSKAIFFDPIIGIRNSWLDLIQSTQFTGGAFLNQDVVHVRDSSKFWGIGPKIGIGSKWFMWGPLYLRTLVDGVLQYGQNRILYKEILDHDEGSEFQVTNKVYNVTPSLDFEAGLGVDYPIDSLKLLITGDFSYVVHYFWNQNRFFSVNSLSAGQIREVQKDVAFQGFSLKLGFRF